MLSRVLCVDVNYIVCFFCRLHWPPKVTASLQTMESDLCYRADGRSISCVDLKTFLFRSLSGSGSVKDSTESKQAHVVRLNVMEDVNDDNG